MNARLAYVDVFRGFAILAMISWHIFNALARSDIYSTPPLYISVFSMPTPLPPPLPFTFVSGIGVYILTKKWLERGERSAVRKAVKRYSKYILLSLPFTALVFTPLTYVRWEEALQGIGLTALVVAIILLHARPTVRTLLVMIVSAGVIEAVLLDWIRTVPAFNLYPLAPALQMNGSLLFAFVFNALVGGWFSVANLLPMALGGVLMMKLLESGKHMETLYAGIGFTLVALLLHALGLPISYYGRSFSFVLFSVGLPMIVLYVLYAAYARKPRLLGFTRVLGRESLLVYMGHFLFVVKPIGATALGKSFSDVSAALLTLPLVALVYALTFAYASWKDGRAVPIEKEKMAV
ncbi:MAG: DUF1624 domain-containing protein [Candidatus Aenigmarchaeota archaeon]|nr:DUF1624 domain-containing protein [Candidatus Aenigmarchaeota archaeon]